MPTELAEVLKATEILEPVSEDTAEQNGWHLMRVRCRLKSDKTERDWLRLVLKITQYLNTVRCYKEFLWAPEEQKLKYAYVVEAVTLRPTALAEGVASLLSGEQIETDGPTGIEIIDSPDPVIEKPLVWVTHRDRNVPLSRASRGARPLTSKGGAY